MHKQSQATAASNAFFNTRDNGTFFSKNNPGIQRKPLHETDIHSPLLDQYSSDSGIPRERVSQHDPGYEAWLRTSPTATTAMTATAIPASPIQITLDMPTPAVDPAPDYSRDETQIGAWEQANLLLNVQSFSVCDHIMNGSNESSFVTEVSIRFTRSDFEYFIARHIYENMNDYARQISERIIWRRIHGRILVHAREHFVRYRQMTDQIRQDFLQRFSALPNRTHPIMIPQAELELYMISLLQFLVARMKFQLWQTTCDWERTDYPVLLRGIPNVSGRFVPNCGTPPVVPPEPSMPIVVSPTVRRRP